jgi:hypothetical protein
MNAFDLVVTVALGSTLATILLSRDTPLVEGVVAFLVLAGMQRLITEASLRSRTVARLVKSEPRALAYRGAVLHDALHEERVLEEELQAAMRAQGLARYEDADPCWRPTDRSRRSPTFQTVRAQPPTRCGGCRPASNDRHRASRSFTAPANAATGYGCRRAGRPAPLGGR